jgi:hypothetical protein
VSVAPGKEDEVLEFDIFIYLVLFFSFLLVLLFFCAGLKDGCKTWVGKKQVLETARREGVSKGETVRSRTQDGELDGDKREESGPCILQHGGESQWCLVTMRHSPILSCPVLIRAVEDKSPRRAR